MSWWPKSRKTPELSAEQQEQGPRSTLLPPPPPGLEATPQTMRAPSMPTHNDAALALIDAALSDDFELDLEYDDFADEDEDDTRPTLRRTRSVVQATPTLPCRFC